MTKAHHLKWILGAVGVLLSLVCEFWVAPGWGEMFALTYFVFGALLLFSPAKWRSTVAFWVLYLLLLSAHIALGIVIHHAGTSFHSALILIGIIEVIFAIVVFGVVLEKLLGIQAEGTNPEKHKH